jgi:glucose/arabinose dehydrogenase
MKILIFILFFISGTLYAQVGEHSLIVPEKFKSFYQSEHTLTYSSDFRASVYYIDSNLKRPRFMAVNKNNILHVADMDADRIFAIPDKNNDGVGDTLFIASPHVDTAHSLAFYGDTMYVAEPSRVRKFVDTDGDGYYETEQSFITGIGSEGPYNHFTRTIIIDSVKKKIYLSVGASCNACRESDIERGTIMEFNFDGSGRRVFASGLRNALGLVVDEEFGTLWAANADRDGQGDYAPPEIVTPISDNGFYGWPFAYGAGTWVDFTATPEYQALLPVTSKDSLLVATMTTPSITFEAHSTPMGLIFYHDPRIYIQAPPKTLLIARHGSSKGGRPIGIGYDVLRYQWNPLISKWEGDTFLKGFLTDSLNYTYWGRPCGIVQDSASNIYLSSDKGITAIYRMALADNNKTPGEKPTSSSLSLYPNPTTGSFSVIHQSHNSRKTIIEMYDALGRIHELRTSMVGAADEIRCLPLENAINDGLYYVCISDGVSRQVLLLVIRK